MPTFESFELENAKYLLCEAFKNTKLGKNTPISSVDIINANKADPSIVIVGKNSEIKSQTTTLKITVRDKVCLLRVEKVPKTLHTFKFTLTVDPFQEGKDYLSQLIRAANQEIADILNGVASADFNCRESHMQAWQVYPLKDNTPEPLHLRCYPLPPEHAATTNAAKKIIFEKMTGKYTKGKRIEPCFTPQNGFLYDAHPNSETGGYIKYWGASLQQLREMPKMQLYMTPSLSLGSQEVAPEPPPPPITPPAAAPAAAVTAHSAPPIGANRHSHWREGINELKRRAHDEKIAPSLESKKHRPSKS